MHLVRRVSVPGSRQVRRGDHRGTTGARAAERDAARRRRGDAARDRRVRFARSPRWWWREAARRSSTSADVVVVSAGAANSAKILLRSANDQHPNGLANGSDQVGRNYMFHNSKAVVALSKELNETVFQKTLAINDFYFGADGYEWPVGNIQMVGKSNAAAMKGEEPKLTKLAPRLEPRRHRGACRRLLAHHRGPPEARESGHARRRRQRAPRLSLDQRRRSRPPVPRAQADPEPRRHGATPCARQELLHGHEHPGRGVRAPGRHVPVRE